MTTERRVITAYCLHWHLSKSSAFHELLVKPLAPYADIQMVGWDGHEDLPAPQADELTIFCQFPPTERWLAQYQAPVIWIPMADYTLYPPNIAHHPSVRMVAFSDAVAGWAQQVGLPYLRLTYYLNPDDFTPADFEGERVMLYWNRIGWFDKAFMKRLCKRLRVDRLLLRNQLDPNYPAHYAYALPQQMGGTTVELYTDIHTADGYMALVKRANMFITPRNLEGVGMTMLEAMARGCVVLGYDAPTMNEYIQDGVNGLLIRKQTHISKWLYWRRRIYRGLHRRYYWYRYKQVVTYQDRPRWQPIPTLSDADCLRIGATARAESAKGYADWVASIERYAQFIIGTN